MKLLNVTAVVHRHIPMKLGMNEFSGYSPPRNQDHLGPNFMYLGFVPAAYDYIHHGFEVCIQCDGGNQGCGLQSHYFCGTPTPTQGPKSNSDSDCRIYYMTY